MRRLERALWIVGVILLATWGAVRSYGAWAAERAVDMSLWSASRVRSYRASLTSDRGPLLAVLSVPRVGIEVPVLEGTDELTLVRGAGHIEGTPGPGALGNVAIAGHRDGFFRALKDVGLGDVVLLRTPTETVRYVVEDLRVVGPEEISVLDPTPEPSLTLVTCYPFYFVGPAPQRYVVRAVRH